MNETLKLNNNNNKNEINYNNKKQNHIEKYNKQLKLFFIINFLFYFRIEKTEINNSFRQGKNPPKISIFLPIYNKAIYLKRSISSLQRQTLKNIEIITVNDCSTDNSFEILNNFAKNDPRIKIINNTKNSGLLFSRAIGILNSKGEYLMNLDPDDEYVGKNSLKYLYYKAKKLKVDFITFFIVYSPDKIKSCQFSGFNKIIKQPQLFELTFDKDNYLSDYYITNKLIKRELLEKSLKFWKKEIYNIKWNYFEDNIWSILIHKYANSSMFVNKNIYIYYTKNNDSFTFNRGNIIEMKNLIFRNKMFRKIFTEKKEEKYILSGYLELITNFEKNIKLIQDNKEIKSLCIKDLNDYINNYNVSEKMKILIENFIIKLNIINVN